MCSWANAAAAAFIILNPGQPKLYAAVYALTDGPLAGALIVWQSAWVFGSASHSIRYEPLSCALLLVPQQQECQPCPTDHKPKCLLGNDSKTSLMGILSLHTPACILSFSFLTSGPLHTLKVSLKCMYYCTCYTCLSLCWSCWNPLRCANFRLQSGACEACFIMHAELPCPSGLQSISCDYFSEKVLHLHTVVG